MPDYPLWGPTRFVFNPIEDNRCWAWTNFEEGMPPHKPWSVPCMADQKYRVQVICRTCGPKSFIMCDQCLDCVVDPPTNRPENLADLLWAPFKKDRAYCTEESPRHEIVAVMEIELI